MSPPINDGEGADSSDDESFVSASAISPVLSKPLPPAFPPKWTASQPKPVLKPKPKLELGPKPTLTTPATKRTVSDTIRNAAGPSTRSTSGGGPQVAPPAGPNSRLATQLPSLSVSPASIPLPPAPPVLAASPSVTRAPGVAASPAVTRTTSEASPALSRTPSGKTSGARPPAVKPKPTISLGPVSNSHFANHAQDILKLADPAKAAVASERFVVNSSPQRTESKRFTTPPPGDRSMDNVVSQRLGPSSTGGSQRLSNNVSTQPIPISRPGRPSSQPRVPNSLETAGMGSYIHAQQPSIGMSVDNLANAMVAGALASRSASRDTRSESVSSRRPPPPPPTRRSGTSIFDKLTPHHSRHGSRAGSPSKEGNGKRKMMTTLRKQKTGSEDEEDGRHGRHRKRNLVKKHPNKHHEGDRKRWRDVVTERERKRYEGLWASNKGIHIGEPVRNPTRWVNTNESTVSLAGSYATNLPGGTQGAIPGSTASLVGSMPMTFQAPGVRVSPYQNTTLSQSQNQSLGLNQPYGNSMQNLSTQSLATTSGTNSGNSPSPQRPGRYILPPVRSISPSPPSECVSSLVCRDIWSRSRLPPDVLREVWDLVDRSAKGMLEKEEFCCGLWLLDLRLKGRKLPQRVSDSVWRSLSGLQGVKVKEFKGRDKVRHVSGGR